VIDFAASAQLGTILLVALPLGAVLCFFDLLGARVLARGEVRQSYMQRHHAYSQTIRFACQIALQSTFHGPLAYSLHDYEFPIFTRLRMPTPEEVETGLGIRPERSFYRNSFSMVRTQHRSPALWRRHVGHVLTHHDLVPSSRIRLHIKPCSISS
jgi:hypothetical protein